MPATRRQLLRHVPQSRLTELAHRLGRQAPLAVRPAVEEALIAQCLLEFGEGLRIGGRLVAQLPGQSLRVDVVELCARVLLRQLLGKRLEFRDVLQGPGALAQAHAVVAAEPLCALPVLARARGL